MISIHLYPLGGLFDEFYNPCLDDLCTDSIKDPDELFRLNGLYWGRLLSSESIEAVVQKLRMRYAFCKPTNIHHVAILANSSLLINRVEAALHQIVDQSTPEPVFFGAVEVLGILCDLYSELEFAPFKLSISDGFVLDEFSSANLINQCLLPTSNPYLSFLEEECFPHIAASNAEIAWIHGPLRMSTAAMAIKAREAFPDIHICITDHSSEYYSLTKITKYLKTNHMLFNVIDSIILEDDKQTQKQLEHALSHCLPLSNVDNLGLVKKSAHPNAW